MQGKVEERKNRFAAIRQSLSDNSAILATSKRLEEKMAKKKERKNSYVQIEMKQSMESSDVQISSDGGNRKSMFFDRYELGQKMGEGAHGVVKKCIDKNTKQICAVKILTLETEHILLLKKNFTEIKSLNHPHILTYKALFLQPTHSRCYLVMDYLPFPSLAETEIESQKEFQSIVYQLLTTLQYIHKRKICHRDIKPQNILYDKDNRSIVIIDFGISKKVEERGRKRDMLTPTGTPYYRAPEMLEGGGYDQKVDMWALGVTMYKLMTGFTPFESEFHIDTISNIIKGQIAFPSSLKFQCSQSPKNLVKRLIKKSLKERFTADQALKDVWFLDLDPLSAEEINWQYSRSLSYYKVDNYSLMQHNFLQLNLSHNPSPHKSNKKIDNNENKTFQDIMEKPESHIFEIEESQVKELPSPVRHC